MQVELAEDFRHEDYYTFTRDGEMRMKQVVYFLADLGEQIPVVQESELKAVHLMDYESALSSFKFEGQRRVLKAAQKYLGDVLIGEFE